MRFSIIVPVYNRPREVDELLHSLTLQEYKDFDVLIVEDGSTDRCEEIVRSYDDKLDIRYIEKPNSGQGFSRNVGFEQATGEYLVVFDSDCIIPQHYFDTVGRALKTRPVDAWGGPDRAHPDFSTLQKAISYSMTSPFTTGGIRGGERMADTWLPRSFNMGIHRRVYEGTGGYERTRKGEDLDFSIRIRKAGFHVSYLEEAWVYHKRRENLSSFFRQLHFFGQARVSLARKHRGSLKWVHLLPSLFFFYLLVAPTTSVIVNSLWPLLPLVIWSVVILLDAKRRTGLWSVAYFSILTSWIQLAGYGIGFLQESVQREEVT